MRRAIWSVGLLCAAFGCSDDDRTGDPFGSFDGGSLGSGGFISGGNASGGGPGSLAGGGTCESQTVQSGRVAPDILIVLDRSLSMRMDGVNRWDPSVAGLKTITSMLQERVSFGLMTFPGGQPRGDRDTVTCDPGMSRVPVARNNANAIAQALDSTQPGGRTPTAKTLAAARQLIDTTRMTDPDSKIAPQYVLLVTDGAPNCTDPNGGGGGGMGGFGNGEPAQVDASVVEIEAMTKAGIRTFVLGYDTQADMQLRMALDRMAAAGGTGDTAHRPIEDQASLVDQFRKITDVAMTCDFVLAKKVTDKSHVKVLLDGKQLNVDRPNGWTLSGDGLTITIEGDSCAAIKTEGHVLNVTVECDKVGIVE
jgi:von Willebrand factor type A domain